MCRRTIELIYCVLGSVVAKIFDKDLTKAINAGQKETLSTTLPAKDWIGKVKGNDAIKFFILGKVEDTEQIIVYQDTVFINLPKITVSVKNNACST